MVVKKKVAVKAPVKKVAVKKAKPVVKAAAQKAVVAPKEVASKAPVAKIDSEEKFVFLGGFNDVFVVVGLGMLTVGMIALGMSAEKWGWALCLPYGMIFWGLAEIFTKKMKLALPSLALSVLFFFNAACLVGIGLGAGFVEAVLKGGEGEMAVAIAIAFAGAGAAALVHFKYFRVPIDPMLAAAGFLTAVACVVMAVFPQAGVYLPVVYGLLGLVPFGVAIWLDSSDAKRMTRRSDMAFWLHMLAAPLLCRATMEPLLMHADSWGAEVAVLVIFGVWMLLALVLNRRALIVSGLGYATYVLGVILSGAGADEAGLIGLCGFFVGSGVLVMAVAWDKTRKVLLEALPVLKM